MRRKQRLSVVLEIAFRRRQQTVDPWKKLLCAVIGVKNDRDSILLSHRSDMESSRDGSSNGSAKVFVVQGFSSIELDIPAKYADKITNYLETSVGIV
jgi:hypothetical protein